MSNPSSATIIWLYIGIMVIVLLAGLYFGRQTTSNKARGGNSPWEDKENDNG